ncbi:hypothetical protein ACFFJX_27685 [Pseudarcicella hirudinis]|uniref:hypothetical protein n=1 Tax=Pseudarcicella hirudinis TaxID=1079859 RepID=UPI0035E74E2F
MTEETCCGQAHTSEIKLLSTIDDNDLIKRYWDGEGNKLFDQELFTYTVDNLAEAFSKGWKNQKKIFHMALSTELMTRLLSQPMR